MTPLVRWTPAILVVGAEVSVASLLSRLESSPRRAVVVRRMRAGDPKAPYFYAYLPDELRRLRNVAPDMSLELALGLREYKASPSFASRDAAAGTFAASPDSRAVVVDGGNRPVYVGFGAGADLSSLEAAPSAAAPPAAPSAAAPVPRTAGNGGPSRGARKKNGGSGQRAAPPPGVIVRTKGEEPRTAYALITGPDRAVVAQEIEVLVGISKDPVSGVGGGELELPALDRGPFTLDVQVSADGFALRDGESWRRALPVTVQDPYPGFAMHLRPQAQDADVVPRLIQVKYAIDGQPIGFAFRAIAVVRDPARLATVEAIPATPGATITLPKGLPADLTATIKFVDEANGRLEWTFDVGAGRSARPPAAAVYTSIGRDPETFARNLMNGMNVRESFAGIYQFLLGDARTIAANIPSEFFTLLRAVASEVAGRPPTVLLLTEDSQVPWELAAVEPALDEGAPPFLAAQATVGRWVFSKDDSPRGRPTLPPPTDPVAVTSMVVVSGDYSQRQGWRQLEEAAREASELGTKHHATEVPANTLDVLNALGAAPGADLFHFACHGVFDPNSTDNGLILVDGQSLAPEQIRGMDFARHPFVFLNACQVGQGTKMLGDYAGMAAAFLYAGASGVIAPLWSIKDEVAHDLAIRFYDSVFAGEAPAEVLRKERARFKKDVAPQSGTYLAYQYFGHPAMRLEKVTH